MPTPAHCANSCITTSPGPGIQGHHDQASADHSSHMYSRCLWTQRRGGAPSLSICLSVSVEVSASLGEPLGPTLRAPCMGTFSLSLRWGAPSPCSFLNQVLSSIWTRTCPEFILSPGGDRTPRKEPSLSTIMCGAFTPLLLLVLGPVLVTQSLPTHLPSHLLSLTRSVVPEEGPSQVMPGLSNSLQCFWLFGRMEFCKSQWHLFSGPGRSQRRAGEWASLSLSPTAGPGSFCHIQLSTL